MFKKIINWLKKIGILRIYKYKGKNFQSTDLDF